MSEDRTALDSALASWFDRRLKGEQPDAAELARLAGVAPERFLEEVSLAQWLVGRHQQEPRLPTPPFALGGFDALEEAGRGAMGVVFRGVCRKDGGTVALKVLPPHATPDERGRERFLRELRAGSQLQHPNLVRVLEAGEQDGLCWYAMQWVAGESLHAILQRRKNAGLKCTQSYARETAALLGKVARALHHVHELGLVHRDVKPANVLVDTGGEPRLCDFGLVKDGSASTMTATGAAVGSPAYMSPEQLRGERVDARSDVYSLGATLYECLTLQLPFDGSDFEALRRGILQGRVAPPQRADAGVPDGLQWICLRAMACERAERHPSAAALAADLEAFARGEAVSSRPPSLPLRLRRFLRRERRRVGIAAGLLLAGAVTVVVIQLQGRVAMADQRRLHGQLLEYRFTGNLSALRETAAANLQRLGTHPQWHLLHVSSALLAGTTAQARQAVADATRALGTAPPAGLVLAGALVASDFRDGGTPSPEQQATLKSLAELPKSDSLVMLVAAEILLMTARHREAAAVLRRIETTDLRVRTLVAAGLAQAYQRLGRYDDARAVVATLSFMRDTPHNAYELVVLDAGAGRIEQARTDAERMRERFPDSAWTAAAELRLFDPKRPVEELEQLAAAARSAADWPQAAQVVTPAIFEVHRSAGRIDAAVSVIEAAVREHPDDPNLRGLLGSALHQAGRWDEGVAELRRAAELSDRLPSEKSMHHATWHWFAGDPTQAFAWYRQALIESPNDPRRLRAFAGALAKTAQKTGDPDERRRLVQEWEQVQGTEARVAPSRQAFEYWLSAMAALLTCGGSEEQLAPIRKRHQELSDSLRPRAGK